MPLKLNAAPQGQSANQPIALQEIRKMTDHYRGTDLKPGDAVSAWVSVSELLQLIADNNANGIRIYYGRHADDDKIYPGKHNVILVSTRDSVHPEKPSTANSVDLLNEFAQAGPVNSVVATFPIAFDTDDNDYNGLGDDAIPLCPHHCPLNDSPLS